MSTEDQDRRFLLDLTQLSQDDVTTDIRHGHVEKHGADFARAAAKDLDPLLTAPGGEWVVAGSGEDPDDRIPGDLVVVDDQYVSLSPRQFRRRLGGGGLQLRSLGAGEPDPDGGPAPLLGIHPDHTIVGVHRAEDDGEPEAPAGELGGEERIEDSLHVLGPDSNALVSDLQEHVVSGRQRAFEIGIRQLLLVRHLDAGADQDPRGVGIDGRFHRVLDQVPDHLPQLRGVRVDRGEISGEVGLD